MFEAIVIALPVLTVWVAWSLPTWRRTDPQAAAFWNKALAILWLALLAGYIAWLFRPTWLR